MLGHPQGHEHGALLGDQRQESSTCERPGSSGDSLRKGPGQLQSYAGAVHRNEQRQTQSHDTECRSGRQQRRGLYGKPRQIVTSPLRHGGIEQVRRHDYDAGQEGGGGRGKESPVGLEDSSENDTDAVQRDLWREDHEHGSHEIR